MIDEEKLLRAGDIAAEARDYGASLVKPGASAREICEEVENLIIKRGAMPAFPCNFSVNEVAAHYTPGIDDDVRLRGFEIVKIDVGAHIDGYIADTAVTVDLSGLYKMLLEASKTALESVTRIMKPNIRIYDIGKTIEGEIRKRGFRPIRNLTGHTIDRWTIHAGVQVPNYPDRSFFHKRLKPGTLVAVEPFATNGRGLVRDGGLTNIYSLVKKSKYKINEDEQIIVDYIEEHYKTLPFTPRWLTNEFEASIVKKTIRSLAGKGILYSYPILIEASKGMVSQFEHTFLIKRDTVIVTTCKECRE